MFLTVDRKEVICWVAEGGVELEELQRVVLAACGEGVDLVVHMLLWGVLREVHRSACHRSGLPEVEEILRVRLFSTGSHPLLSR